VSVVGAGGSYIAQPPLLS